MNRLLLDQGLAPRAAAILRQYGCEAIHVAEIEMERAEDTLILEKARTDESVCVTLDHDFHAHLAMAGSGRPSVVLLRVQGLDAQGQADLIRSVCIQCEPALSEGAAVSADRESFRVRRLPLRWVEAVGRIESQIFRLKDGAEITLRTAIEQDAAPLFATITAYIADNEGMAWAPDEYRKTEDERREFILRKLDNPAEILILAELDGAIVGNINFHVGNRQRTAHVGEFGMGMLPRVRSRGLGTLLLNRLIAWANDVPQLEKINLRVISNNLRAMGLYRKLGFLEEGRRVWEIKYSDGSYADEILMARLLR